VYIYKVAKSLGFSFGQEKIKLDYSLIPYKGNEVLIFESNKGETDTIFLAGTKSFITATDPLDIFPTKAEHYYILARSSDPSLRGSKHRYLTNPMVELSMSENNETYLKIDFTAKDAWFYGDSWLKKDKLMAKPKISMELNNEKLNDVVVFEDLEKHYYDRTNHVEKLYWSLSKGIVRFEKKDNEVWELKK